MCGHSLGLGRPAQTSDTRRRVGYLPEDHRFPDYHTGASLLEGQSIDPVVDLIRARGLNLRHLVEKRQTLEDLFVQTVQDK